MNRAFKVFGWTAFVGLLLIAALAAAVMAVALPLDRTLLEVNGVPMNLAQLGAGHTLIAAGGVALALLIVLLVVPVAVLVPLAIAALAVVGGLLVALVAIAGAAALVFSPLILVAGLMWLIVRLARGRSADSRGKPGATIAG